MYRQFKLGLQNNLFTENGTLQLIFCGVLETDCYTQFLRLLRCTSQLSSVRLAHPCRLCVCLIIISGNPHYTIVP